jgi:hypothetical protein
MVTRPAMINLIKLLPPTSDKWLHSSVIRRGVGPGGRLRGCALAKDSPKDASNSAALKLVRRFRAAPLPDRSKLDTIRIALEFKYDQVTNMGDCAPDFCTPTLPPPPPPPPPRR